MRSFFPTLVFFSAALLVAGELSAVAGQVQPVPRAPTSPPAKPAPTPPRVPATSVGRQPLETTEQSINVDSAVNIKFCVSDGSVKINGWNRDEVRLFVSNGRRSEIKVLERNKKNDQPNWIWLVNAAAASGSAGPLSNCLAGKTIELDVPVGSGLTFEARTSGVEIDMVKNVDVSLIEGSISIRNVPGGVKAVTYQGDVVLENSGGAITLKTTTGNILAYDVSPGNIGDILDTKTSSGSISLQKAGHRQIKANTISGSVIFNGDLLAGSIYTFKTSNGAIQMQLPSAASGTFVASLGFGSFNSAIPIEVQTENITPGGKSIVAQMGTGTARVNLTTTTGRIAIQKQQ